MPVQDRRSTPNAPERRAIDLGHAEVPGDPSRSRSRIRHVGLSASGKHHSRHLRDGLAEQRLSQSKYQFIRQQQLQQKAESDFLLDESSVPVLPKLDELVTVLPGEEQPLPMLLD